MSFFENFSKKVSDAAQTAAKKSSEIMEVTKISLNISSEEDKIRKLYSSIGKKLYETYASGNGDYPEFASELKEIDEHIETIKKLKARIMEARNLKICPNCEEELARDVQFCPKCGTKQEIPEPSEIQEEGQEEGQEGTGEE